MLVISFPGLGVDGRTGYQRPFWKFGFINLRMGIKRETFTGGIEIPGFIRYKLVFFFNPEAFLILNSWKMYLFSCNALLIYFCNNLCPSFFPHQLPSVVFKFNESSVHLFFSLRDYFFAFIVFCLI